MKNKGLLLLTSGGYVDNQRSKKCDEIIEKLSTNKKVLLVNNATTTGSNLKAIDNLIKNFSNINSKVNNTTLTLENLQTIKDYDVIYFTGGDIAPLINLANNTNIKEIIKEYLNNGGIIIGESAGSIIFSEDCKWCYDVKKGTKPKYNISLPTYEGLGFTNINIYPHFNKVTLEQKEILKEYQLKNNIKITPLKDGEYIEIYF